MLTVHLFGESVGPQRAPESMLGGMRIAPALSIVALATCAVLGITVMDMQKRLAQMEAGAVNHQHDFSGVALADHEHDFSGIATADHAHDLSRLAPVDHAHAPYAARLTELEAKSDGHSSGIESGALALSALKSRVEKNEADIGSLSLQLSEPRSGVIESIEQRLALLERGWRSITEKDFAGPRETIYGESVSIGEIQDPSGAAILSSRGLWLSPLETGSVLPPQGVSGSAAKPYKIYVNAHYGRSGFNVGRTDGSITAQLEDDGSPSLNIRGKSPSLWIDGDAPRVWISNDGANIELGEPSERLLGRQSSDLWGIYLWDHLEGALHGTALLEVTGRGFRIGNQVEAKALMLPRASQR